MHFVYIPYTNNFFLSCLGPVLFFVVIVAFISADPFMASQICPLSFKMVEIVEWDRPRLHAMANTFTMFILVY